jgi:hemerythrin-like domain-containing protein
MLVQIGAPPPAREVLDRMLECHERIRRFARLARDLASSDRPSTADAERVQLYFSTSFLTHALDEDESLFPMLAGKDPDLDAAMEQLGEEHAVLEQLALKVAAIAGLLAIAPDRWSDLAPTLREPAEALIAATDRHLALEESEIFPRAKAVLDKAQLDSLDTEVRARRRMN